MKYRISNDAQNDLLGIAEYGIENYGIQKSEEYREKLKDRFDMLCENPYLYPQVDHIMKGYRRSVCGVHSIFYRVTDRDIEIMRVMNRQKI